MDLGIFLVVVLLSADPSADEVITDGVSQGEVVVTVSGHVAVFNDRVVDVTAERLLHIGHILHKRDATHTDLFAPVLIRLRLRGHRN